MKYFRTSSKSFLKNVSNNIPVQLETNLVKLINFNRLCGFHFLGFGNFYFGGIFMKCKVCGSFVNPIWKACVVCDEPIGFDGLESAGLSKKLAGLPPGTCRNPCRP